MKELLYYPGFEIKDINWLKFALLYFDKIRPIVPIGIYNYSNMVSRDFYEIVCETDLIDLYSPAHQESVAASYLACSAIENYLKNPIHKYNQFGQERDVLYDFKNNRNTVLYSEKFTPEFYEYCLDNKLADRCNEGIVVSEKLAFVYMSFLADVVSKNNNYEMITDNFKCFEMLMPRIVGLNSKVPQSIVAKKRNIKLDIPYNITKIPLDIFVSLRKNQEFNKLRKAYIVEIDKYLSVQNNTKDEACFEEILSYKRCFKEFCNQMLNMTAATILTAYNLENVINTQTNENIGILLANTYMNFSQMNSNEICDFLKSLKNKHYARKYISNIKKITRNY